MKHKYNKYGQLLIAFLSLLFGVSLIISAIYYFSLYPVTNHGVLLKRAFLALFFAVFIIFGRAYKVYSQRKKNKDVFREASVKKLPDTDSFVGYLKATHLLRLVFFAMLAILSVFLLPTMASPTARDSTLYIFFAIVGGAILLIAIPWIIYILIKK